MRFSLSARGAAAALFVSCLALPALAQTGGALEERLSKIEQATAQAQSAGDNAWMLVCAALVLMMTGPGLALFYGGLVRKKNALATLMQSFTMMAVVTVVWAIYGYSLAFSEGNAVVGSFSHLFLRGVGAEPNAAYAATIPQQTFMIYQLMFAVITPALITGAFAERMKFSAMLLFMTLWVTFIYLPLAHMVWGAGGLLNAALGGRVPTLDFAGGTVVHVSSGVSALVCALVLGKRIGYPKQPMRPHNLTLSFVGACLLWVGWFGFNAGSALGASSLATSAFVTTHFASAAAALGWMAIEWVRLGKPTVLGAISGAVAGLVAITPGAGFVTPMAALLVGAAAGLVCYLMTSAVKRRFGYDDSLDVFGIHGVGGCLGALLTGVLATSAINPVFKDAAGRPAPVGLLEGNAAQLLNQLAGVALAAIIAGVGSYILLKLVDALVGLRVTEEDEITGLDLTQHGEEAYELGLDLIGAQTTRALPGASAQRSHVAAHVSD
ncbi:MAG: ammonium transporter, Amt family [Acidobacteriota bacterium]|nr:ammonium transporter, Amt family [Acidobacteriota bacterium]